jgi:hypothetical protein
MRHPVSGPRGTAKATIMPADTGGRRACGLLECVASGTERLYRNFAADLSLPCSEGCTEVGQSEPPADSAAAESDVG